MALELIEKCILKVKLNDFFYSSLVRSFISRSTYLFIDFLCGHEF